jgi:DNA-directed RNA polymerase specialized sigma subunit
VNHEKLFDAFLPLARKRVEGFRWTGQPRLAELMQVASMALWQAVQRYDVRSHNNGLAAFAIPWIDGALKRFTTRNRSIVGGKRTENAKTEGAKRLLIISATSRLVMEKYTPTLTWTLNSTLTAIPMMMPGTATRITSITGLRM